MYKSSLESLIALGLPSKQFMVMGSGILEALGIRNAEDIDLVVSDDVYGELAGEARVDTRNSIKWFSEVSKRYFPSI